MFLFSPSELGALRYNAGGRAGADKPNCQPRVCTDDNVAAIWLDAVSAALASFSVTGGRRITTERCIERFAWTFLALFGYACGSLRT